MKWGEFQHFPWKTRAIANFYICEHHLVVSTLCSATYPHLLQDIAFVLITDLYFPCNDSFWNRSNSAVLDPSVPSTKINLTSGDNLRFYLGIYGGLVGANSIFTLFRAFLFAYGGLCAARTVHKRLLSSVMKVRYISQDTCVFIQMIRAQFHGSAYPPNSALMITLFCMYTV